MPDLDRSFGFLINEVARLFGRRFDHNAQRCRLGLTRAQCRIIGYLARNEGINQAGLADLLEVRPMTLVRQIDRMELTGWIERRADPGDRRARRLFLTEKGRRVMSRIWDIASDTRDEALARLPAADGERVIALLQRVRETLSERLPAPQPIAEPDEDERARQPSQRQSASRERQLEPAVAVEAGR